MHVTRGVEFPSNWFLFLVVELKNFVMWRMVWCAKLGRGFFLYIANVFRCVVVDMTFFFVLISIL